MDGSQGPLAPGAARCPGLSWDDMLAAETRPVPKLLTEQSGS